MCCTKKSIVCINVCNHLYSLWQHYTRFICDDVGGVAELDVPSHSIPSRHTRSHHSLEGITMVLCLTGITVSAGSVEPQYSTNPPSTYAVAQHHDELSERRLTQQSWKSCFGSHGFRFREIKGMVQLITTSSMSSLIDVGETISGFRPQQVTREIWISKHLWANGFSQWW